MKESIRMLDPLSIGFCFTIIVVIVIWFIYNIIESIKNRHLSDDFLMPIIVVSGAGLAVAIIFGVGTLIKLVVG